MQWLCGLGTPALLQPHPTIGYVYQANQDLYRFGNHLIYNEFHQRSGPLRNTPNRILMIGDSVLNGGSSADQTQTISELLQNKLQRQWEKEIEVLNASGPSWAIENEYEYLQCFGTFQSKWVILQLSIHDLWQIKSTEAFLGTIEYPTQPFPCAWAELWCRYIWPSKQSKPNGAKTLQNPASQPGKPSPSRLAFEHNLDILGKIHAYVQKHNAALCIVLIPEQRTLKHPIAPYEMNDLAAFCNQKSIQYLNLQALDMLQPEHFYDNVHLNPSGNEAVSSIISIYLCRK